MLEHRGLIKVCFESLVFQSFFWNLGPLRLFPSQASCLRPLKTQHTLPVLGPRPRWRQQMFPGFLWCGELGKSLSSSCAWAGILVSQNPWVPLVLTSFSFMVALVMQTSSFLWTWGLERAVEAPTQHLFLFLGLNRFFFLERLEWWDELRLGYSGDGHDQIVLVWPTAVHTAFLWCLELHTPWWGHHNPGCGSPHFMDDEVRLGRGGKLSEATRLANGRVCASLGLLALSPGFVPKLHMSYQLSLLSGNPPGLCVVQSGVQTLKEPGKALGELAPPLFLLLTGLPQTYERASSCLLPREYAHLSGLPCFCGCSWPILQARA